MTIQKAVEAVEVMAFVFQLRRDDQLSLFVGLPEQVSHTIAPLFHDGGFWKVERLPLGIVIVKTTTGDREVNMDVPLQVTPKGMQDSENTREHTFVIGKGLNGFGRYGNQFAQQLAVKQKKYP